MLLSSSSFLLILVRFTWSLTIPSSFSCVPLLLDPALGVDSFFFFLSADEIPTSLSQFVTSSQRFFHIFSKKLFHAVLAKVVINSLASLNDCIRSCNETFTFSCTRPLIILIQLLTFSSSVFPHQIVLSSSLFVLLRVSSESVIQAKLIVIFSISSQPFL